ncbi:MAG: 5-demethoxyubiquinol-8 5-hydroxylase UbiM, partial [Cellvibrionaceae bacterium]|nr:5-demethoxyubiquinol-8 5-hydroxylase UbiM [Cellvibrionaceae bacterium]
MPNISPQQTDVLIIGAGPAGLSFALCLAESGLKVTLVDQLSEAELAEPALDGRDIAMNHLSKGILEELGVWQRFDPAQVHLLGQAKVMDGIDPYSLHFERGDKGSGPLGYLVANNHIRWALYQQLLAHPHIELLSQHQLQSLDASEAAVTAGLVDLAAEREFRLQAKLVAAADSRFSVARRMMGISAKMRDFGKVMMVCNMRHEVDHQHTAQEWFQYGCTCAILPLGDKTSSIVITANSSRIQELQDLSEEAFNREVQHLYRNRLGAMSLITERFSYPLVGAFSNRFVGRRFALIGDAAVGMHPVTAHGYNLGLRSADTLAGQVINAHNSGRDIGSTWVLHNYEARHMLLSRP